MKIVKVARKPSKPKPLPASVQEVVDAKKRLRRAYKTKLARLMRDNPTKTEQLMIDLLTVNGIEFGFQVEILGYIPDFYFKQAKAILEVDGAIHKTEAQEKYDRHRDKVFIENGFRVLRIRDTFLIRDPDGVLDAVQRYLKNGQAIKKKRDKSLAKASKRRRARRVPKVLKIGVVRSKT